MVVLFIFNCFALDLPLQSFKWDEAFVIRVKSIRGEQFIMVEQ